LGAAAAGLGAPALGAPALACEVDSHSLVVTQNGFGRGAGGIETRKSGPLSTWKVGLWSRRGGAVAGSTRGKAWSLLTGAVGWDMLVLYMFFVA
jgi:hypothetical protein